MPKSCFNCKNLKTYSYPGTLEEPPDQGWDCLANQIEEDWAQCLMGQSDSDEAEAKLFGQHCPAYEYFDWPAHDRAQAESEAAYLRSFT